MKRKLLNYFKISSLVMFLSVLFIYGCKKNIKGNEDQTENSLLTVKEAQSFFENQILPNSVQTVKAQARVTGRLSVKDLSKENDLLFKHPVWDKAYEKFVDNGKAIAVPIHFDIKSYWVTGDNKGIVFSDLNYLLITKKNNGEMTSEWVTMYPDQDYLNSNRAKYTGRIIVADWDGNIKAGYIYYKDGTIKQNQWETKVDQTQDLAAYAWTPLPKDNAIEGKLKTNGDIYQTPDGNCWKDIREIPSADGLGVTLIRKKVPCDTPPVTPNDPTPTSPAGGVNNPGTGTGGGGNYPPPNCNPDPNYVVPTAPLPPGQYYIQPCASTITVVPIVLVITITNDVSGCNGSVIETLLDDNMLGTINDILELFNDNGKVNLHFVESTDTNGAAAAAKVTSGATSSIFNVEIRINTTLMPADASQEYKASLILHEIIHAYLDYKNIDLNEQLRQHSDIARDFVGAIAAMLVDAFKTSPENAMALAFGGLGDFARNNPTAFKNLVEANGLTLEKQAVYAELERSGIIGLPCPPVK